DYGKGPSLFSKIKKTTGDVAKSVAEGVTQSYKRVGRGVAETLAYDTEAQKEEREAQDNLAEQNAQMQADIARQLRSKNLNPAKRRRLEKLSDELSGQSQEQFKQQDERNREIIERTDPIKGAAAVGSIGFDILTAGTVSTAGKTAAKEGGKQF